MNPDSAFMNLGVLRKPIPSMGWSGWQQAMHFQSCRERQCSAWQARRNMPISHLCRGERSLGKSRGAQRRNSRTETHRGDKSLKIYCHLIQQITTHSRIRNNRNFSSKQNKIQSTFHTKANFLAHPQRLIFFSKRLFTTEPKKHIDWDLGFKSLNPLRQ